MNTEEDYIIEKLAGHLKQVEIPIAPDGERFIAFVKRQLNSRRDETYEEWKARKEQE